MMNSEQFEQLSQQGYNRIPVCREILADLDTPLSAYLKVANAPYSYLLESVQGGEQWGRYSIIGLPARRIIQISGHDIAVFLDKKCIEQFKVADPLHWIEHYQEQFNVPVLMNHPRFTGGLVGYFSYDTVRYIEPKLADTHLPDSLETPDILLMLSDEVLVFDNLTGRLHVIVHADPNEAQAFHQAQLRLSELIQQLRQPLTLPIVETTPQNIAETDFISGFTQEKFEQAIDRAKAYIIEGDIMQVVLSQRLSIPCDVPPLDVYRILRGLNPSPYLYFFNLDSFHIVGSSPEILVRLQGDQVTVRPIAGTRPRGKTAEEDAQFEQDLLNDPKELAEHLMLIDLGRNDVGRVAEIGSVHLSEKMLIERYSHVMHIVSNVTGKLRENLTAMDVLRAAFPAGTLSGAPKIRAMEIIDELEPVKRGIYGGAVGYLSWQGDMDLAIAIRTAVIKNQQLHIQAGAGIVADSVPENEWQETMNKGRAMFRAVALAAAGLHQG